MAIVGFSLVHGAAFLALKTTGDLRERARTIALRFLPVGLLPLVAFLVVVQVREGKLWTLISLAIVVLAAAVAWLRLYVDRDGQAFAALAVVITAAAVTFFGALYPNVLPSTLDPAHSLTIMNSAVSHYTLTVMTWVGAFGAPAVLIYQGWTYWVFRKRIGVQHIPAVHAS
ncbi:Cytochrome bd-I ubiquinol oxidase subunit 2 [Amycolatopsis sp. M39]|nr:Cytochrome bd-I ubiquinol oxidase subunit 2 [Amycolatopsis sp. M39]